MRSGAPGKAWPTVKHLSRIVAIIAPGPGRRITAHFAARSDEMGRKGSEMISDAAYFTIRADEERSAAMNASQTIARQTHLKLANRYQDMADAIIEAGVLLLDDLLAA